MRSEAKQSTFDYKYKLSPAIFVELIKTKKRNV